MCSLLVFRVKKVDTSARATSFISLPNLWHKLKPEPVRIMKFCGSNLLP